MCCDISMRWNEPESLLHRARMDMWKQCSPQELIWSALYQWMLCNLQSFLAPNIANLKRCLLRGFDSLRGGGGWKGGLWKRRS